MDLFSTDKYSLCCSERANWSAMNEDKREDKKDEIWDWAYQQGANYFILLCREKNDYTVFNCRERVEYDEAITIMIDELTEVLDNRGKWIAADYDEQNHAWQLWVNRGGQANAYLFFDAEGFVIEC